MPSRAATERETPLLFFHPFIQSVHEFDNIPTFLFRLHAPGTVGTTTTTEVTSPAYNGGDTGKKRGLFQKPPAEAAELLNAHLWWQPRHEGECNLMSWSSSLLFLLQYGLHRHSKDHDRPGLSDVHLLTLDTRQFPKGTFIQDLEAIKAFGGYMYSEDHQNLRNLQNLRMSEYYFGEYLSQGRLDISERCSQTSMKQLIDMGLFKLCPMLAENSQWNLWAKRVVLIRKGFADEAEATDKTSVRTAITMAQMCFGADFALPLAVMLLSLKNRKIDDWAVLDGVRSMFTGELEDATPVFCRQLTPG